jgi:large conductance mechanosensitive channel
MSIKDNVQGFFNFIREQGVIGLAVGFILGGSVTKVVTSLVTDIINPVLGIFLGASDNLKERYWQVGGVKVLYGNFLNNLIDFIVIALVIYFLVKLMRVDRLDKKKDAAKPPTQVEEKPIKKAPTKTKK